MTCGMCMSAMVGHDVVVSCSDVKRMVDAATMDRSSVANVVEVFRTALEMVSDANWCCSSASAAFDVGFSVSCLPALDATRACGCEEERRR